VVYEIPNYAQKIHETPRFKRYHGGKNPWNIKEKPPILEGRRPPTTKHETRQAIAKDGIAT
jgi:hypothetical protein